jgi:hypothetical protein
LTGWVRQKGPTVIGIICCCGDPALVGKAKKKKKKKKKNKFTKWCGTGPKSYTYDTSKGKAVCKVKGFTLNYENKQKINRSNRLNDPRNNG